MLQTVKKLRCFLFHAVVRWQFVGEVNNIFYYNRAWWEFTADAVYTNNDLNLLAYLKENKMDSVSWTTM